MVTTICFIDNLTAFFAEAFRVLIKGGTLVVAFVGVERPTGKKYIKTKGRDKFYKTATFYSANKMETFFVNADSIDIEALQSLFSAIKRSVDFITIRESYDSRNFVVLSVNGPKKIIPERNYEGPQKLTAFLSALLFKNFLPSAVSLLI